MKDVRDALMVAHTSDGRLVRRPLSPHLQVYRPQITSILSIMNRLTGIALSVGTLLMVWWLVAAASGPGAFDTVQGFIGSPVGLNSTLISVGVETATGAELFVFALFVFAVFVFAVFVFATVWLG